MRVLMLNGPPMSLDDNLFLIPGLVPDSAEADKRRSVLVSFFDGVSS